MDLPLLMSTSWGVAMGTERIEFYYLSSIGKSAGEIAIIFSFIEARKIIFMV
jgi:hypothetical protein